METFAGFAEHTDVQIGRLVDTLAEMDKLDNTVIFIYLEIMAQVLKVGFLVLLTSW